MKKTIFFLCLLLFFICFSFPSFAARDCLSLNLSHHQEILSDGNETGCVSVAEPLEISSEEPMQGIYLIYFDTPTDLILSCDGEERSVSASFLRKYISIKDLFGEGKTKITLSFSEKVDLMEIYAFSGEIPSWVQIWKEPLEKADLCLFSTHADDEQLFFAGVLPYYAGQMDFDVQVIYFVDHNKKPHRRHELLQGLWSVGVENYPVISPFPDRYSMSEKTAEEHFSEKGFSREDILSFQVEMLRRFQPLVVIGHDPLGEYGHGQHILNSSTLQEAVLSAGEETVFPESAEKYGVWEVPKTYLHLLGENEIVMDWDVPLDFFGGKTAYEMSKIGFSYHKSQHKDWFLPWLVGEDGKREKATEIDTYSPCCYGLFRSLVGEDKNKNDFFENLLTYQQQDEKAQEERIRLEEEEKARLAEEKRKAEEIAKKLQEEKERKEKRNFFVLSGSCFLLFVILFLIILFVKRKKK